MKYDAIIIGFGTAGRAIAVELSKNGKKVAIIEENEKMYGGTCINIGCVPTKNMMVSASKKLSLEEVISNKNELTKMLRTGSKKSVENNENIDLYTNKAQFLSNKVVKVGENELTAENIIISTGARSRVLDIKGIKDTKNVVDSTGLQNITKKFKSLGIIGGGNIGLEMAGLYSRMGVDVVVFEAGDKILKREDDLISQLAKKYMEEDGTKFILNSKIESLENDGEKVVLSANGNKYIFDVVMYATGRIPNVDNLGLENTDIDASKTDEFCMTNVEGVYIIGDARASLQFTYIAYDDYRVVASKLLGDKLYDVSKRKNVPYTIFLDPPLSSVGIKEKDATNYKGNELLVTNMLRPYIDGEFRGVFKVVVDKDTDMILGATLFSKNSHEIINLIKLAMDNNIPYTYFKNQVFTHPTMAENLNNVFNF